MLQFFLKYKLLGNGENSQNQNCIKEKKETHSDGVGV